MARATSSLPVPVSPVINTVLRVAATSLDALESCRAIDPALADDAVRLIVFVNGRRWRRRHDRMLLELHSSLQVRQLASLGISLDLGEHATR